MNKTAQIKVISYDEQGDSFKCEVSNSSLPDAVSVTHQFEAVVLPHLVGFYGEPDEFIGQTFAMGLCVDPSGSDSISIEDGEEITFNSNHNFSVPLVFEHWGFIHTVFDYDFLNCYVNQREFREWLSANGQKLLDAANLDVKKTQVIKL